MKDEKSIVIMGAGIGGLTVAHEMCKYGFKVRVFERLDAIGGVARSITKPQSGKDGRDDLPAEYCWSAYGGLYDNLYRIMREISIEGSGKTVFDSLTPVLNFPILMNNGQVHNFQMGKINVSAFIKNLSLIFKISRISDIPKILDLFAFALTSSKSRLDSLDDKRFSDFLNEKGISDYCKSTLLFITGTVFGLNSAEISAATAIYGFGLFLRYTSSSPALSVMGKPSQEAWFKPWQDHLENNGVEFNLNCAVDEIVIDEEKIKSIQIRNLLNNDTQRVEGDYFCCSMSLQSIAHLLEPYDHEEWQALSQLLNRSQQTSFSPYIFLNKKINYLLPNSIINFPDSPWGIMLEPVGDFWPLDWQQFGNGEVRDVWAPGLGIANNPGILYKKRADECTPEEIVEEMWYQIMNTSAAAKYMQPEDGSRLQDVKLVDAILWPSFSFKDGKLMSSELKFSNNTSTLTLRPKTQSNMVKNMVYATAYTQQPSNTTNYIYYMEGAVEAALYASKHILEQEKLPHNIVICNVGDHFHKSRLGKVFSPLRYLDGQLHARRKPHLSRYTCGSFPLVILELTLFSSILISPISKSAFVDTMVLLLLTVVALKMIEKIPNRNMEHNPNSFWHRSQADMNPATSQSRLAEIDKLQKPGDDTNSEANQFSQTMGI